MSIQIFLSCLFRYPHHVYSNISMSIWIFPSCLFRYSHHVYSDISIMSIQVFPSCLFRYFYQAYLDIISCPLPEIDNMPASPFTKVNYLCCCLNLRCQPDYNLSTFSGGALFPISHQSQTCKNAVHWCL